MNTFFYSTGQLSASHRKPTKKEIERIAKVIIRLRKKNEDEENKLFNIHKSNNVGFLNGCISQTYSEAYETFGLSMSEIDAVIGKMGGHA